MKHKKLNKEKGKKMPLAKKVLASQAAHDDLLSYRVHELKIPITALLGFSDQLSQQDDLADIDKASLIEIKKKSSKLGRLATSYLTSHLKDVHKKRVHQRAAYSEQINETISGMGKVLNSGNWDKISEGSHSNFFSIIVNNYKKLDKYFKHLESSTEKASALIDSLFNGTLKDYRVEGKKINLERKYSHTDLEHVTFNVSDLSFVYDVFSNNAIEAGAKNIELSAFVKNGYFQLRLKDDGKGIPLNLIARIGHPGETYGKANGTGFGVSRAKEIIEHRYGGSLKIESDGEGTGTQATILIPLYSKIKSREEVGVN